jgi:hypothetical protein
MRATKKICQIHILLAKSKTYLESKKEAPDKMDAESEIEELIGYAWKLEELERHGLFEQDVKLVELCFHVRREGDKKQADGESFCISLNSGKIYRTRNHYQLKAKKHIKEEDSVFSLRRIPKLYIYPSRSLNPRTRWEDSPLDTFEDITPEVYKSIKSYAHTNYAEVIKTVKNQLKDLSLFQYPAVLVSFAKIMKLSKGAEMYAIRHSSGDQICLKKGSYCQDSFIFLLDMLTQAESEKNVMLLLFENDVETGKLFAQPPALVTDEKIIRLAY